MMDEYMIYIENHDIKDFTELIFKARNTGILMARLKRNARTKTSHNQGWMPSQKRTYEVAFAQKGKWAPREEPPEFPCKAEKFLALIEAWIQDGSLELPRVDKLPKAEDKKHPKYCCYHQKTTHPIMVCYALRRIFDRRLKRGDVILDDSTVEETLFPHHKEVVMMIITKPGEDEIMIEEVEEGS